MNKKIQRILSLVLALTFVLSCGVVVASAEDSLLTTTPSGQKDSSITSSTIDDVREILESESYEEYWDEYHTQKDGQEIWTVAPGKGEIVIEKSPTEAKKKPKFFKLPIIRGVFSYIDSMTMGTKCLMRSAEISGLEEAEQEYQLEKKAKKAAKSNGTSVEEELEKLKVEAVHSADETETSSEPEQKKKKDSSMMNGVMFFSVVLGIAFSILLFIVVPTYLYKLLTLAFPVLKF